MSNPYQQAIEAIRKHQHELGEGSLINKCPLYWIWADMSNTPYSHEIETDEEQEKIYDWLQETFHKNFPKSIYTIADDRYYSYEERVSKILNYLQQQMELSND